MQVELDRKDLEALVKGYGVSYSGFNHPLVKVAGHSYSDQYGRTSWGGLSKLSDEQLYVLYCVCKNSWK